MRDLYRDPSFASRVLSASPTWPAILSDIDAASQQRLSFVQNILDSTRLAPADTVNVIVTSSSLVAALGKCVLFKLAPHFDPQNVFSSCGRPGDKVSAFRLVRQRFGDGAQYLAIGDGEEERVAAEALNWPFHGVKSTADLVTLYKQHLDTD